MIKKNDILEWGREKDRQWGSRCTDDLQWHVAFRRRGEEWIQYLDFFVQWRRYIWVIQNPSSSSFSNGDTQTQNPSSSSSYNPNLHHPPRVLVVAEAFCELRRREREATAVVEGQTFWGNHGPHEFCSLKKITAKQEKNYFSHKTVSAFIRHVCVDTFFTERKITTSVKFIEMKIS